MAANLDIIAPVIQLAVAPVFLLTGIGALLGPITTRLGRIIDRARTLEAALCGTEPARRPAIEAELRTLTRRARLINRAITLCVVAALLICAVIAGLFVMAYYAWSPDLTRLTAAVFGIALIALISGLLCFLREVYVATASLRFGAFNADPGPPA